MTLEFAITRLNNSYAETLRFEINEWFRESNMHVLFYNAIKDGLFDKISPEFSKMATLMQHNDFHNESVLEHTLDVMQYLQDHTWYGQSYYYGDSYYECLMWSALLHDIGKVNTLTVGDDGRTHFYNHENESVAIFKSFADELGFPKAEQDIIEYLIIHHMDMKCFCDGNFSRKRYKCIRRLMAEAGSPRLFHCLELLNDADLAAMHKVEHASEIQWVSELYDLVRKIETTEPSFYNIELPISMADICEYRNCDHATAKEYMDYLVKMMIGSPEQTATREKCIKLVLGAKL